jgi:hypothetical protein
MATLYDGTNGGVTSFECFNFLFDVDTLQGVVGSFVHFLALFDRSRGI